MSVITNRYEGFILIEATNSAIGAGFENGGEPRVDMETGHGEILPIVLKRKIRDYIESEQAGNPGFENYIQRGPTLRSRDADGYASVTGETIDLDKTNKKQLSALFTAAKKTNPNLESDITAAMCRKYFDVRSTGAVMTLFTEGKLSCGGTHGPVQLEVARSIDPVTIKRMTIGRVACTSDEDSHTLGTVAVVAYGLYMAKFHISPVLAQNTGFSEEDLEILLHGMVHMFDDDCSAWRAGVSVRKLVVFDYPVSRRDITREQIFDAVSIKRKDGIEFPRSYHDYDINIDRNAIPNGINIRNVL